MHRRYCAARQRLPLEFVSSFVRYSGALSTQQLPSAWRRRGRAARLVDGTTLKMPDTPANQAVHPQTHSQKPGWMSQDQYEQVPDTQTVRELRTAGWILWKR